MANAEVEKCVNDMVQDLPDLGKKMQLFSLAMRSLYCEKSISRCVEGGSEFIKLRDDTRNDAVTYMKGVMPLNESCVRKLATYFDYYKHLTFCEWEEGIEDILAALTAYQQSCLALVKIHEYIMAVLKRREDDAKVLCKKFSNLGKEYDDTIAELQKKADIKFGFAIGLAFIPGVCFIATPILGVSAHDDKIELKALQGEQGKLLAVAKTISDILIPALKNFTDSLGVIAGFFSVMKANLESLRNLSSEQRIHYRMVNKKTDIVIENCKKFQAVLPSVRSDFQAIPCEGVNSSYVNDLLNKLKKVADEECKCAKARKKMRMILGDAQ